MSDLIVEIVRIDEIKEHPNADRLELAIVKGWQCVIQKDVYVEGQKVVYFPIDSILPQEIESKLFPPDAKVKLTKSRIKTIRLRKAISQGMVVPLDELGLSDTIKVGKDVCKKLGITKYEPQEKSPGIMKAPKSRSSKWRLNKLFKKYTNINNIKHYPNIFNGENVVITEKIHGCIQANTMISLADGTRKTIKDIVDNKLNCELIGMDKNENFINTRILNWYNNGKTEDWYRVKFTRNGVGKGNYYGSVIVTKNHRFYCQDNKEYIECQNLKIGDKVLSKRSIIHMTFLQKQILIGKMLGDGSLSNGSVHFGHKKEHEEYIDYTLSLLGEFAGNKEPKYTISGYGTKMCRARSKSSYVIKDLFSSWFRCGNKIIPNNLQLSPISLAFWYMDDGSLSHNANQEDRIALATNSFTESCIDILLDKLHNLGIKSVKYQSNGWRIRINSDNADKFFSLIIPYIPKCMQYKLPEYYRNQQPIDPAFINKINKYKSNSVEQEILSIQKINIGKNNKTKYDIGTETNNFIANNVVVHNSNFRAGWLKHTQRNWFTRFIYWIKGGKEFEFVFGSHNRQLQTVFKAMARKTFYKTNVYLEAVEKYSLRDKLTKNEIIYGEIYGYGIQKGYHYGCKVDEHKMVVFDVMVDGEYLNSEHAIEFCKERGLDYVPVLYSGVFDKDILESCVSGKSVLSPKYQPVREGCVICAADEHMTYAGRAIFKHLNDKYLLKDQSEWK